MDLESSSVIVSKASSSSRSSSESEENGNSMLQSPPRKRRLYSATLNPMSNNNVFQTKAVQKNKAKTQSWQSFFWNGTKAICGATLTSRVIFPVSLLVGSTLLTPTALNPSVIALSMTLGLGTGLAILMGRSPYVTPIFNEMARMGVSEAVASTVAQIADYYFQHSVLYSPPDMPYQALSNLHETANGTLFYYHPDPTNTSGVSTPLTEEALQYVQNFSVSVATSIAISELILLTNLALFTYYGRAKGDFAEEGRAYKPGAIRPRLKRAATVSACSLVVAAGLLYLPLRNRSMSTIMGRNIVNIVVRSIVKELMLSLWAGRSSGHGTDIYAMGEVGLTDSARSERLSSFVFPMFAESFVSYGPLALLLFDVFPGAVGVNNDYLNPDKSALFDHIRQGGLNVFTITMIETLAAGVMTWAHEANAHRLGQAPQIGVTADSWRKAFLCLQGKTRRDISGILKIHENQEAKDWWKKFYVQKKLATQWIKWDSLPKNEQNFQKSEWNKQWEKSDAKVHKITKKNWGKAFTEIVQKTGEDYQWWLGFYQHKGLNNAHPNLEWWEQQYDMKGDFSPKEQRFKRSEWMNAFAYIKTPEQEQTWPKTFQKLSQRAKNLFCCYCFKQKQDEGGPPFVFYSGERVLAGTAYRIVALFGVRSILYAIDDKAAFRAAIYFLASALEWGIMGTLIIAQGPARRREYIYLRKQKELASIATEVTEVPEVIVSSETDTEENKKDATEIDTKSTDQASQKVSKARRKRMQHVKKSQAMEHSVTTSEDSDKSSDQASQKASKTRRKHRQGVEKSKPMRHSADGAEESSIV